MPTILIVDDEQNLTFFMKNYLQKNGFEAEIASQLKEAKQFLKKETPDVMLLDLQLPDGNGLEFYKELHHEGIHIPTIIITAHGSIHSAVEAMKHGVDDYIIKPFEMDELIFLLQKEIKKYQTYNQLRYYLRNLQKKTEGNYFISNHPRMKEIHDLALRIAQIPESIVLLEGASGTGKEMLARYIHQHSPEKDAPFVEINCAAVPSNLLESELFGYEPGAFTDARKRKLGLIELAEGGTLFLDEINEMDLGAQAKLLRFIEQRSFKRLGGVRDIQVKVRIIAATNQNIKKLVEEKKFRNDLYFRLSMFHIQLPTLKERKEEILLLAQFFLEKTAKKFKKKIKSFSEDAQKAILEYDWPGNLRELHNVIERAVILCDEQQIKSLHLQCNFQTNVSRENFDISLDSLHGKSLTEYINTIELQLVKKALLLTNGNQMQAAKLLKIPRHVIRYLIKKHQL